MPQVKESVEYLVKTKKNLYTLVQVCHKIWKGNEVCRGREKFENHCFLPLNESRTLEFLKLLSLFAVYEPI